jgi:hypothetical protein
MNNACSIKICWHKINGGIILNGESWIDFNLPAQSMSYDRNQNKGRI